MKLKQTDDLLCEHILASGRIYTRNGLSPVREYNLPYNVRKLSFYILTRYKSVVKITKDTKNPNYEKKIKSYDYQTVRCGIYSYRVDPDTYSICRSLKNGEIVLVTGNRHDWKFTDKNGEEVCITEINVDSLIPVSRINALLAKGIENKPINTRRLLDRTQEDKYAF